MIEKKVKVDPKVKIHPDQIETIKTLATESNNTYADMFRMILTLGIEAFRSQQSVSDKQPKI